MAVDNRSTANPLAALVPDHPVTIEFVRNYRRPKHLVQRRGRQGP